MKILFDEFSNVIMTVVCGIIVITIVINTLCSENINLQHNEKTNYINPVYERIDIFECKDVVLNDNSQNLLENVTAYSNTGINIKDYVVARMHNEENNRYIEYILKYNNDFQIKKVKYYLVEEFENEDNV